MEWIALILLCLIGLAALVALNVWYRRQTFTQEEKDEMDKDSQLW